jgi:hypothetical protein
MRTYSKDTMAFRKADDSSVCSDKQDKKSALLHAKTSKTSKPSINE